MTTAARAVPKKEFLGHPVGLFILFFTEMWERFSYYGMRALLVMYMISYLIPAARGGKYVLGFQWIDGLITSIRGNDAPQPLASLIYGLYTGLVYFTPVIGGYLADRFFGQRKTVVVGGILMAIGHFLMAVESMFFVALFFLILGNGCFKPNISTQVGSLYPQGDHRRDGAFSIFYMGINLGAFFSPLVCGTLGQIYGWHYGFTAAGVGMIAGLLVYLWGAKYLGEDVHQQQMEKHKENKPLTERERKAIWGLVALCLLNVVFWAVYEQQGNTIQVFADNNTDWSFLGFTIPSSWFQAFNPMFIFIFTPLLTMLWSWQSKRKKEPTSVGKMAIGSFLLGFSFIVMIVMTKGMGATDKISYLWLALTTLILTIGEIYLSPIGLSLVTKAAPAKYVSVMMGVWLASSFLGNILSGFIGVYYDSMSHDAFFTLLLVLGVATGFAFFMFQRPLKKAIGEHNL